MMKRIKRAIRSAAEIKGEFALITAASLLAGQGTVYLIFVFVRLFLF